MNSRWFPFIFALVQTARHFALIAYDYHAVAVDDRRFDLREYVRRDLARPLFEPYGFCGAYTHYASGQSAVLGLDLPAYATGTLLFSAINGEGGCVDALTTPRGQSITIGFVLPLWFLVGLSIRRLAQGHWRRRIAGRYSRALISLGLTPLPLGVLGLLFGVGVLVSDVWLSLRLLGFAFWILYIRAMTAERLRVWPFHGISARAEVS